MKKGIKEFISLASIIYFYRVRDEYGEFSNFYRASIVIDGVTYPTSEHYFQSKKFEDTQYEHAVRECKSPNDAAIMGRDTSLSLREDWEHVKEDVMYRALFAKFTQHPNLKKLLLSTNNAILVEHTTNDRYWADGGTFRPFSDIDGTNHNGAGRNRLGILLIRLRSELQNI